MRTKKLCSLLLAVLMLCSLSVSAFAAETAQASVPVVLTVVNSVSPISVSVPACLPVTVLDGYVVTASNAVIENRAQSGAVQVVAVDVQPGAFAIGDYLEHEMSISQTASALYIQRSSLVKRLNTIHKLIPEDLTQPDIRLHYRLCFAMLHRGLIEKTSPSA